MAFCVCMCVCARVYENIQFITLFHEVEQSLLAEDILSKEKLVPHREGRRNY